MITKDVNHFALDPKSRVFSFANMYRSDLRKDAISVT